MNPSQKRYYLKVKDTEEYKEKNRVWRRAYYEANKDEERKKALERYYRRKQASIVVPNETTAPNETPAV